MARERPKVRPHSTSTTSKHTAIEDTGAPHVEQLDATRGIPPTSTDLLFLSLQTITPKSPQTKTTVDKHVHQNNEPDKTKVTEHTRKQTKTKFINSQHPEENSSEVRKTLKFRVKNHQTSSKGKTIPQNTTESSKQTGKTFRTQ